MSPRYRDPEEFYDYEDYIEQIINSWYPVKNVVEYYERHPEKYRPSKIDRKPLAHLSEQQREAIKEHFRIRKGQKTKGTALEGGGEGRRGGAEEERREVDRERREEERLLQENIKSENVNVELYQSGGYTHERTRGEGGKFVPIPPVTYTYIWTAPWEGEIPSYG